MLGCSLPFAKRQLLYDVCWRCRLRLEKRHVSSTKLWHKTVVKPLPETLQSQEFRLPLQQAHTSNEGIFVATEKPEQEILIRKHTRGSRIRKLHTKGTVERPIYRKFWKDGKPEAMQHKYYIRVEPREKTPERSNRRRSAIHRSNEHPVRKTTNPSPTKDFRDGILGLIQDEMKVVDATSSQLSFKQTLRAEQLTTSTIASFPEHRHSTKASQQTFRPGVFSRRMFSSFSRHNLADASPTVNASPVVEPLDNHKLDLGDGNIREYLASWQIKQNEEEIAKRAFLNVPFATLSASGLGYQREGSTNEVDEEGDELSNVLFGDEDTQTSSEFHNTLRCGDLVEFVYDNQCTLAIFVRRFQRQIQLFTQFGRWIHFKASSQVWYCVPKFCKPEELNSILPYLPAQEVPDSQVGLFNGPMFVVPQLAGQALAHRMNEFIREADMVYRQHAEKIDKAYDTLAHAKEFSWMHINEITRRVLKFSSSEDIPAPTIWAVHRALILYHMGFLPDVSNHWRTGIFEILSKQDMELVNQIKYWVREHQEYSISQLHRTDRNMPGKTSPQTSVLGDFAKKIKPIIQKSRALRQLSPSGNIGPTSVQIEPDPLAFRSIPIRGAEPTETLILRFLEMWSARRSHRRGSQLWALGPMILRSTGVYQNDDIKDLDTNMGFTFLQETGVIAPWETRLAFNSRLALPGLNFDPRTDRLLVAAAESARELEMVDSMAHLRQDWGDLEVFCIDRAGTREVDDGFSIEPIADDDSCCWIHVHIANPTAFINPDHPMALYAEQLTETLYFPGKAYNMLSPAITQAHFSLDRGRPVLTFSAKVNTDGSLLETKVTPSRIHNVLFVSPDTVFDYLSPRGNAFLQSMHYTVGRNPPPSHIEGLSKMTSTLSTAQVEKLRLLQKFGAARRNKCFENLHPDAPELRFLHGKNFDSSFRLNPEPEVYYLQMEFPWRRWLRRIEGDPTIEYRTPMFRPDLSVDPETAEATQYKSFVQDIMLLAGEIAASWSAARGVPIVFRGTADGGQIVSQEAASRWKQAAQPGQKGEAVFLAAFEYALSGGKAVAATQAIKHDFIGVEAYARVTSPLRRYGDMMGHWQIEAALRSEARLGRRFTETDASSLPFSKTKLQGMVDRISQRESLIRRSKQLVYVHWCHMLVLRNHDFGEPTYPDPIPKYLEGFVHSRGPNNWNGWIKELGLSFKIPLDSQSPHIRHIQVGDWWKVSIANVVPHNAWIEVEPVELLSRL